MRPISALLLFIIVLVLILVSCSPISAPIGAPISTATPTEDIAATQAFERDLVATVLSSRRTEEALEAANEALQMTVDAHTALAQTETVKTMQAQETLEAKATRSEELAVTRAAKTAHAIVQKTEQASVIYERVQELFEENAISTTKGKYHRVDDFDESWAQINWYQWWRTGLIMENFVVRVDAEWESASNIANWFASGCGFVYSENGTYNHYAAFLALDGNVYNHRVYNGVSTNPPGGYYGTVGTPNGNAELMMVVDQSIVSFYVNGKRVSRFSDSSITKGDFALTLNSGTNLDYGTRCKMSNVDVWELK